MSLSKPISIDFRLPLNLSELAQYIDISEELLRERLKFFETYSETPYEQKTLLDIGDKQIAITHMSIPPLLSRHNIPKRGRTHKGETRVVWEASSFLADAYKAFARKFDLFARFAVPEYPHSCAYGYVRDRGTIDNAKGHCHATRIIHADIKNFFPSISIDMLQKMFLKFGIKEKPAEILAKFLTIKGTLPLGLHPSPLLANLICLNLDDKLQELSSKYGCVYTRYADDISISGNGEIPEKIELKTILEEEGFILSEKKFRITKLGQSHFVTGLSVTDSKPRIPRLMKKRLRQELYYCNKYGITEHIDRIDYDKIDDYIQRGINRIDGMVMPPIFKCR